MSDPQNIWVIGGRDGYTIGEETYELLTEANSLAKGWNSIISVLLFGSDLQETASTLSERRSADRIYVFQSSQLQSYNPDIYLQILKTAFEEQNPFLILIAATSMGKDLAPRLAYRLGAGFISNVQQIKLNAKDECEVIKPIYGEKVHANFRFIGPPPWIATMIPGVVGVEKSTGSRSTVVTSVKDVDEYLHGSPNRYRVTGFVQADPETMDISEADIVVAGGRGVSRGHGFDLLREFAHQIGGVVGCTRPIVDENVLPLERQIGQTGKTINPNLFISCGISGAIQHEMGMKDSKEIVAINSDPQAIVFRIAGLKVVGDVNEILPLLIEKIRKRKDRLAA